MEPVVDILVPLKDFLCFSCSAAPREEVQDPAAYSRGLVELRQKGKNASLSVEVRVKRLLRKFDPISNAYSVSAILDLRCPSCTRKRESALLIARLPVRVVNDVVVCPKCGGRGNIDIYSLNIREINELTDRVTIRGQLQCQKCKDRVPLTTEVGIHVNKVVEASQSQVNAQHESPALEIDSLMGTADLAVGAQVVPLNGNKENERKQLDVPAYDVALSFAGEDRSFVFEVATHLRKRKIAVFYDRFETVELWGKDLYRHLDKVYRRSARVCVVFLSENYIRKQWATHELRSAQARAFEENREYILPCRFDQTEIPGITPTIGYIDVNKLTSEELAEMIARKLKSLK